MKRLPLPILLVIAAVIILSAALAILLWMLSSNDSSSKPLPSSAPLPSASPRAVVREPEKDHDKGIPEFIESNPIVKELPHYTRYWNLLLDGEIKDGVAPLRALVFHNPTQNSDAAVRKQRPYIERWIAGTGQKRGTYKLRIVAKQRESY